LKLNAGEHATTTIDRSKESLLLVVGHGETVVKFLSPDEAHPMGSWYVESGVPLEVVKVESAMTFGRAKKVVLKFTERGEEVSP